MSSGSLSSTLCPWLRCLLCLGMVRLGFASGRPDPDPFLIFSSELHGCLESQGNTVGISKTCNSSAPAQKWLWVSRRRLFNIDTMRCISSSSRSNFSSSPVLFTHECDHESFNITRRCETLMDQLSQYLVPKMDNASQLQTLPRKGNQWWIYGTNQSVCSSAFVDIYTIQGNSHGRPCAIPFKYYNQWFYDCTTMGREDGHLWCATTTDYNKEEKWGFCPVKSSDCETFWDKDPLTGSCYQFNFQSALSWNEALVSCSQQGASLLSINELHEQTYINGLLTGYSSTLWIGLNDLDINGGWQWTDSSPLKYLNWENNQPSNSNEENCAVVQTESSGRWQTQNCGVALPYACKKKTRLDDPFSTESWTNLKVDCEPGWQGFQANCYRLTSEKKSWTEAKKICQRGGGDLVSIHTLPELEFVIKRVKQGVEELWIGLNDLKLQMNFEWSDGTPVRFTYWHPFEPNNFWNSLEDCVTIWGPDGRWNDSPCNQTLPSICKKHGQVAQEAEEEENGCRKGWKWHSPSCYWLGQERVSYSEAQKICSDYGATLVTIINRFEQAYISSQLNGAVGEYFWTALQDLNQTGIFRWLSNDDVMFTHWNRDQPGYDRGGCVVLATGRSMGLWEVKDCTSFQARYICQQSLGTSVTPELPVPYPTPSLTGTCPQGWSSGPNLRHCYKVFHSEKLQEKKTWMQAQVYCRELGAQLLSIGSMDEEHFVAHLLNKNFGESESEIHEQYWFWIGLNKRNPGGDRSWTWSDGLGYAYNNFDRSSHDDDDIRSCVVLDLASLQWMALQCETQLDWICKLPRGKDVKEPEVTQGSKEWVRYLDAEYKFFEHQSTWLQSQRICTWFRAELVSVHNQAELDFLGQNLQKFSHGQEQHWWIGLHTYENDGRFRWSDKTVLNFVAWALGKPWQITKDKKCVYMTASREDWGDQKCLTALPYICKRSNRTTVKPSMLPPLMPSKGGCPRGWLPFSNKCFGVHGDIKAEPKSWQEAQNSCKLLGGDLAILGNHLEQAFITSILPNVTLDLWIGLHDNQREFQWVGNEPLKYVNWAPGEPSGYRTTSSSEKPINCAVLWHGSPPHFTGRWDDRNCQKEKHGFICQISKVPSLNPPPDSFPPTPTSLLTYHNSTYFILQKPLSWLEAMLLCETRDAVLASVPDPFQQAFLILATSSLQASLWIGLANEEGARSYSWLTEDGLSYVSWQDGEPQQLSGCAYMDASGMWRTTSCSSKLSGAICKAKTASVRSHKWSSAGSCPKALEDSAWIPFREFCYIFHMEITVSQKDATKRCQKAGAKVLSILDETENIFVWEHLQTYESQSKGAWLGMSYNPKGGTLVWHDNTAVNYSNWGQHDTGPSMLSPNSCYWIQGTNGLWQLGSCSNITMGVICKLPRDVVSRSEHCFLMRPLFEAEESSFSISALPENTTAVAVVVFSTVALCVLVAVGIYLYRRRQISQQGTFEGARYSRTTSSPNEAAEKNILVSDMEMNEQQE